MPILAYGSYTAAVTGSDSDIVEANVAQFTYYPIGRVLLLAAIVVFLVRSLRSTKTDYGDYSKTLLWVFAPVLGGLLLLVSGSEIGVSLSMPLFLVTGTLFAWRFMRVRGIVRAAFGTWIVAFLVMIVINAVATQGSPGLVFFSAFISLFFAFPIILFRITIRGRPSTGRLVRGLAITFAICLIVVVSLYLLMGAPMEVLVVVVPISAGVLALTLLPLAALIRWNPWARAVVTGAMFESSVSE